VLKVGTGVWLSKCLVLKPDYCVQKFLIAHPHVRTFHCRLVGHDAVSLGE
jgi:hypothetical protein